MSVDLAIPEAKVVAWTRRHLLALEDLSRAEIESILDTAEGYVEVSQRRRKKLTALKGKVVVNLFFEPSTRTRTSFGLAAKRLNGVVVPPGPTLNSDAGWRTAPGGTWVGTPGCYAWQIDGLTFSHVIIFEAVLRSQADTIPSP